MALKKTVRARHVRLTDLVESTNVHDFAPTIGGPKPFVFDRPFESLGWDPSLAQQYGLSDETETLPVANCQPVGFAGWGNNDGVSTEDEDESTNGGFQHPKLGTPWDDPEEDASLSLRRSLARPVHFGAYA